MVGRPRTGRLIAIAAAVAATAALAPIGVAQAATITVTEESDDVANNSICSLREAIDNANDDSEAPSPDCDFNETQPFGDDTINLGPGQFVLTRAPVVTPTNPDNQDGDLDLDLNDGNLTIDGAGAGATTIDGNETDRVLEYLGLLAPPSRLLTIRELTVRDGKTIETPHQGGGLFVSGQGAQNVAIDDARFISNEAASVSGQGGGGGISFNGGNGGATSLTITDSMFSQNSTAGSDGGGGVRVQTHSGTDVDITDSTVSDNDALGTTGLSPAAGIALTQFAGPSTVTLSGTTVSGNDNRGFNGGGISLGPGNNLPSLTVEDDSRITGNFARDEDSGGGVGQDSRGGGIMAGPLGSGNTLVIRDSEVSGNDAAQGSGGGVFFGTTNQGNRVELNGATVSGNTAGRGAGVDAGGTVEVLNTTVSDNTADDDNDGAGAGIFVFNSSFLELRHSTVADNLGNNDVAPGFATDGVHIFNSGGAGWQALGSIVADDPGDGLADDTCGGVGAANLGFNIDDGSSCAFGGGGGLENTEPLLDALADNGGPVPTRALLPGSQAIDLVPSTASIDCDDLADAPLTVDARGFDRPFPSGGDCDAGAYELHDPDGDGVPDPSDGCPGDAGPQANGGCPVQEEQAVIQQPLIQPPPDNTACESERERLKKKLKKADGKKAKRKLRRKLNRLDC